ncbi:MAG: hypothetical protein JJE51_15105 [Thermoanaerobaculia bacterium]|nr:hypothetical protein [Thermoanaerobaculia bacterium]
MMKTALLRLSTVMLLAGALTASASAESLSVEMAVSTQVIGRTLLTMDRQPSSLVVTDSDVARGYIDLPGAVQFQVRSNVRQGYMIRFDALPEPFARAQVEWNQTQVVVGGADQAFVAQPYARGATAIHASVRLDLAPQTAAGTYPWPLTVAADSL